MSTLRFLQFSDLHFGARVGQSRLKLSPPNKKIRQEELNTLVKQICETACNRQVDLVLVPGDLWDSETISADDYHYLIHCFSQLNGIPLVIAPGNHDYYSSRSFYHPHFLNSRHYLPWPENTLIFTEEAFQTVTLPGRPDVRITGCAFQGNMERTTRPLKTLSPIVRQQEGFDLLLFHGSRDDTLRPSSKSLTAPFTPDELFPLGYDYTAVGHYHRLDLFQDSQGIVRGAYAGCPFGRGLDESGSKYVLYGEIHQTTSGVSQVEVEPIVLDHRRIIKASIDISPYQHTEALTESLYQQLMAYQDRQTASPVTAEDMIVCTLTGQLWPGFSPNLVAMAETLSTRFFHIQLECQDLLPGFNYAQYEADTDGMTFESRFYHSIQEKIRAETDESKRHVLANALKYGLHALRDEKKIEMLYEH